MRIKMEVRRLGDEGHYFDYCTDDKMIYAYKLNSRGCVEDAFEYTLDEFMYIKWIDTKKDEIIKSNGRYLDKFLRKLEGRRDKENKDECKDDCDCECACRECPYRLTVKKLKKKIKKL